MINYIKKNCFKVRDFYHLFIYHNKIDDDHNITDQGIM